MQIDEKILSVLRKYDISLFSLEREDLFTYVIKTQFSVPPIFLRELKQVISETFTIKHEFIPWSETK